jgi:hypothetical protein
MDGFSDRLRAAGRHRLGRLWLFGQRGFSHALHRLRHGHREDALHSRGDGVAEHCHIADGSDRLSRLSGLPPDRAIDRAKPSIAGGSSGFLPFPLKNRFVPPRRLLRSMTGRALGSSLARFTMFRPGRSENRRRVGNDHRIEDQQREEVDRMPRSCGARRAVERCSS